jgi:hypothetical protein
MVAWKLSTLLLLSLRALNAFAADVEVSLGDDINQPSAC